MAINNTELIAQFKEKFKQDPGGFVEFMSDFLTNELEDSLSKGADYFLDWLVTYGRVYQSDSTEALEDITISAEEDSPDMISFILDKLDVKKG